MAGNDFIERIGNPDDGILQLPVGKPARSQERPVRRPLRPLDHEVASLLHDRYLLCHDDAQFRS